MVPALQALLLLRGPRQGSCSAADLPWTGPQSCLTSLSCAGRPRPAAEPACAAARLQEPCQSQAWMRRQFECPNQQQEVFKLPEVIQSKANEQYERDVARMAGERPVAVQLPYSSA